MDKPDLDARVMRLERRVGFLTTMLLLAGLGLAITVSLGLAARRAARITHATVVTAPPPPSALPMPGEVAPEHMMGDMDMVSMMGHAEGSVAALRQKLASLKQLRDEGLIAEEEWKAMKTRALEGPITPGELRSDLQMVRHLFDSQVICDMERAELRAKLLGIGE